MKISVIIPAYQAEKTIEECLRSIFSQSFQDFEIIVVNDGSTDKTLEILDKYKDKIKILSQENKGAPAARNNGFGKSTGHYLFFCDADVILSKDALETLKNTLENNPGNSYAYSGFKLGFKIFKSFNFDLEKLRKFNYICTMSLIRREHFPGFDEKLKRLQDWDLWLSMSENRHYGVWIPRVLIQVKKKGGISSFWLPSFLAKFHQLNSSYKNAYEIIKKKHRL
jgi:glycosyltransferase involved in cell wall biosynthesis